MACKIGKCCCCISIKCGTNIIGGIHAVYLFLCLYAGALIGATLNFFSGTAFIVMLVKDSAMTRGIFCASFITYVCLINALNIYAMFFRMEAP